jgi:hypothetical protein
MQRAQNALHLCHVECRRGPLPADVPDDDRQAVASTIQVVKEIAAHFEGR